MNRHALLNTLCAGLLILAPAWMPVANAGTPPPILVCYPGGQVPEAEAGTAMNAMLQVIERLGDWKQGRFTSQFTTDASECRQLFSSLKPAFAIASPGLFLEQRDTHHLVPLVQPKMRGETVEQYRIMVQKGRFTTLNDLKGKSLGGTLLEEPAFLEKIVFDGKLDPASFFNLKPGRQAIRALRALDKGEVDAVILNGQQYAALTSLPLQNPLEAIHVSSGIPLMGMLADSQASTAEDRARLARSLESLCTDPEGKKLCDLFGIEAFVPANTAAFDALAARWNGGRE